MWEQIRSNRRKSIVLVLAMMVLLVVLGAVIGEAFARGGWTLGLIVATAIWLVMTLVSYFRGSDILMAVSGARKIEKKDHPQLINIVEEMQIAAGLSRMPDVYIMDDRSPNAFATGRNPDHAAIAVTTGLLKRLNRDQLQGVIAHEMSHIVNRDVMFMTMIGVMLGAIVLISQVFLRGTFYGRMGRRRSSSRSGNNQAQALFMILALVLAILAPILAQVIYFAASRRREYLADANAAVLTRYPEGLASALEAISGDPRPMTHANKVTAPMYISNPLEKSRAAASAFSTHPPIGERVHILRSMAGGASFKDYQQSWKQVAGDAAGALPSSALAGAQPVALRQAQDSGPVNARSQLREAGDALRRMEGFRHIACDCGVGIKLPPEFQGAKIRCPRCRKTHKASEAQPVPVRKANPKKRS